MDCGISVKVAVRIRPLDTVESIDEAQLCINTIPGAPQIIAGTDTYFTFDHVFGVDSAQSDIYDECVVELVNAAFEGFNATILAYGQTGSGKTWTMGSGSSDMMGGENFGIIPRVITNLFEIIQQREEEEFNSSYKVHVQFLEIYGEDIKDLLDHTKTSKVTIRESATGDVFVAGAREEVVSSASQMLRALGDGSRHRTTASTLMNSSSSRSHAIFTIFLEQTIDHSAVARASGDMSLDEVSSLPELTINEDLDLTTNTEGFDQSGTHTKEVRRCKFHFVDLAGSERAKRTGAQGHQLKEGIDINKGLLALGNVISALGDEQRKGKVHVPYRVSKLTRMLQDSLGGNSKTLMICCVSPSEVNFHESLNALRYANRARNIKNKPKINRDPTLVMISDLKDLVQVLATELVDVRRSSSIFPDNALSLLELENIVLNRSDFRPKLTQALFSPRASKIPGSGTGSRGELETEVTSSASGNGNGNGNGTGTMSKLGPRVPLNPLTITKDYRESSPYSAGRINSKEAKEIASLKSKVTESDSEVKRLTEKLRQFRVQSTDQAERLILTESERDYFRMKWSDLNPEEAATLSPSVPVKVIENEDDIPPQDLDGEDGDEIEKKAATRIAATYLREISTLRRQLAEKNQMLVPDTAPFGASDIMLESELATNVARVIAQTEKHLKVEARRLRSIGVDVAGDGAVSNVLSALDEGNDSDDSGEIVPSSAVRHAIEEEDLVYQRRQKVMIEEVAELGESIELKEQLLGQLRRSHHQYGMMKAFYEQKLTALNAVMGEKQQERERMVDELNHFELNTTTKDKLQSEQENRLRVQLQKKDDELRLLKKRQEELSSLSKVQSRYMAQLSKLEADIDSMRKQKVDLSKALQVEKKKHFILLNDKAREIDKLKKDLIVTAGEAKRLGQEKVRAEEKVKEALKSSALMRRKLSEIQRPETPRGKSVISRLNRSPQGTNVKILSEDDFNTKKWLDSRIADINAREEAADTLRKQFEQQLALLNRKESLEKERSSMKGMRAVVTAGSKTVLSEEEEEALQEIEDRIESVEGQLKLRDRNISEIQSKLGRDISPQDGTVEALQSTVGSLPAAHELIALLFNMLVSSKSVSKQRKTALLRVEGKEKVLRVDLDEANKRMKATIRAHDMELTRSANEYEEKLLGLFSHSSIGQIVRMESELYPADTAESVQNAQGNFSTDDHYAMASQSFSLGPNSSLEPDSSHRIRIAATTEQSSLLKSKLERESRRNVELQIQNSELSLSGQRLQQELEEKAVYVKFLEDERTLFRDVADRLRAGISVLGGSAGEVILSQIKDDEDDDEDCEGFRGEFTNLGEIITRTGSVTERIFSDPRLSATAPGGTASGSRDIVYDRLTNPSNFTGAMKNAFGDDLAKKRQKVQQIKSSHPPKRLNGSGYDFKLSRVDSMRGSKETVNSNDGAPSTPTAADGSLPVPPSLSRRSSNQHLSRAVSSPDTNSARPASMSVIDIGRNRADRLAGASFSPSSSIKSSSDDSSVTSTASLAYHPGASPRGTPIKSKRSASATRGRRSSSSKSPTAPSDTEPDNRREKDASNSGLVSYELSLQQEDVTQIPPASPTALSSVTLSPRSFDETNTTGSNAAGNRTPEEAENPGGEGSSIPPPPMDDSSPNPKRSIGGMMKKLFGTRRKSNPDVSSDLPSFFPVPSASQKDDTQAAKSGLTHSKFLPSFSKKNRNGRDVEDPNQGGGSTPPSPSVQEEKDSNTEEAVVVEERIEEVEKEIIEEPNIEEPIPTPPLEDDTESPNTDISPHGNESSTNTTYDSWESGVQLTREEKQIQRVTSRLQSATSASPKGKVSPRASIPQAEGKKR